MKWNVYIENFNEKKIETFNIFDHLRFVEDCQKAYKKFKDNKEQFIEEIRRSLAYYYWSKCEWEIILSDWPPSDKFNNEKIDVYDQVMLNWHIFSEYIWEHRDEFKKKRTRS